MLELLKIQGLGPKTIALLWSAFQVSDVAGVEKLAREGKLRELPRLSEKSEQKILKAIENYRRITRTLPARRSRPHRGEADRTSEAHQGHREDHAGRLAAARPRNGRRSRHAHHRTLLCRRRTARRAHRGDPALPRHPGSAGEGRQQGQLQAAQRYAGGRAHCCRRNPTARPCSTSPAPRTTTSRCASAR